MASDHSDHYGLMGHPVKFSRSPFVHALFAKQTKQHLTYRLLDMKPELLASELPRFFAEGGKGLNITVPHKQAVLKLVKYCTPRAELAGAINTIMIAPDGELMGDNTDGIGLLTDLNQNLKFELKNKRVLLLGAGGAASGVLAPLLQQHPAEIVIANRNVERAASLAAEFHNLGTLRGIGFVNVEAEPFDLIINATSASMHGEMPAIPAAVVGQHSLCYDMAYGKDETAFTHWAKQLGAAQTVQGWGMLVEQAAEAFFLWRGVRPDTVPVLIALQNPPPQTAM